MFNWSTYIFIFSSSLVLTDNDNTYYCKDDDIHDFDEVIYYNDFIFNLIINVNLNIDCVGHVFDDDYLNHHNDFDDDSYRVKSSLMILRLFIIFHDDDNYNGYDHENGDDEDKWDMITANKDSKQIIIIMIMMIMNMMKK